MDDKYEEIVNLGIDHPSNDGQCIIQSKQMSEKSNPADHKNVELGKVCSTRKLVSSISEAMPSCPKTGNEKRKHTRNKSYDQADPMSQKLIQEKQKTKRSSLFCCGHSDSSEDVKEEQTLQNSEGPQDWQIREWNAELRENERVIKEAAIQEKENEVIIRRYSLERKEIEIEEKNHLLEIAISLESQVEDLEQKSDVTSQASGMLTRRTYYTPAEYKNSEIDLKGDSVDNSTQGSDETYSPSSH